MEEVEIIHPGMLEQIVLISQLLRESAEYGLEAEVIAWSLKSMQEDPSQQPYEAFAAGYNEWIK
jgi:hypothetical protein